MKRSVGWHKGEYAKPGGIKWQLEALKGGDSIEAGPEPKHETSVKTIPRWRCLRS